MLIWQRITCTEYGPECPELGCAITCAPQNCGLVGNMIEPWNDPLFFGTLFLSLTAASFGMSRFLRKGPMTLVPRKSHGISFFLSIFITYVSLMSKAALLGLLLTSHGYILYRLGPLLKCWQKFLGNQIEYFYVKPSLQIYDELIRSNYESTNPVFTNFFHHCYDFFQLLKAEKKKPYWSKFFWGEQ